MKRILGILILLVLAVCAGQNAVANDNKVCGRVIVGTPLHYTHSYDSATVSYLQTPTHFCFTARYVESSRALDEITWLKTDTNVWIAEIYIHFPSGTNIEVLPYHIDPTPQSKVCLRNRISIIEPNKDLLVANPSRSPISMEKIQRINSLVFETMKTDDPKKLSGVGQRTMIYFTQLPDDLIVNLFPDLEKSVGQAQVLMWDGCSLFLGSGAEPVGVALVQMTSYSPAWNFGTILHELAHIYGAAHGKLSFPNITTDLDRSVSGAFDAYWWTFAARNAWGNNCGFAVYDHSDETMCLKIKDILYSH